MSLAEAVQLVGQQGMPVVAAAVVVWLAVAASRRFTDQDKRNEARYDQLLALLLNGAGNGSPSIGGLRTELREFRTEVTRRFDELPCQSCPADDAARQRGQS